MKLKCPCPEKVLDFGNLVNSECKKAEMALSVEEVKILRNLYGLGIIRACQNMQMHILLADMP